MSIGLFNTYFFDINIDCKSEFFSIDFYNGKKLFYYFSLIGDSGKFDFIIWNKHIIDQL